MARAVECRTFMVDVLLSKLLRQQFFKTKLEDFENKEAAQLVSPTELDDTNAKDLVHDSHCFSCDG
jgi:hypothetical protein